MKILKLLMLCLFTSVAMQVSAQLINMNPDPDGEPWWAGGLPEITPEIQAELDAIPSLTLTSKSLSTPLPAVVDNSQQIWFRPIFNQDGGSCGQASGIGYLFTYEINRIRNLPAHLPRYRQNHYPTHYTWNYINGGTGSGSFYYSGWDRIKDSGIPNVDTYGCLYEDLWMPLPVNERRTVWMTGYDKYQSSLTNRVDMEYYSINVSTPEGLETLKHWLNDHGKGAETGGLVNFGAKMPDPEKDYGVIPYGSDEAGKKIVLKFGHGSNHAMTIVGYNDNIKYDFNEDDEFTNPEGNMAEWEIGAVKVANSWGTSYPDPYSDGFVYVPYRLLASGPGTIASTVHVLDIKEESHTPKVTMRAKIQHPERNRIEMLTGLAANPDSENPTHTQSYRAYRLSTSPPSHTNGGGYLPMQGINDEPIEVELDVTEILGGIAPGKFFFNINEWSPETIFNGQVLDLSLVDYDTDDGVPIEIQYTEASFPIIITNNANTQLAIEYDYLPSVIDNVINVSKNIQINKNITIINGGKLVLKNGKNLTIANNKTLIVESGGILESNDINIEPGSNLIVNNCGTLKINNNAILSAQNGSILSIYPDGIIDVPGHSSFDISSEALIPHDCVHPIDVVPPSYIITESTQNWSGDYRMVRNLVIQAGADFTLQNPNLEFFDGRKIEIYPGGILTINGGVLSHSTSVCNQNNKWGGIVVRGNPNAPQTFENQGAVIIREGAIIENSYTAISLGIFETSLPPTYNQGGIVQSTDVVFRNNSKHITFYPYQNIDNDYESDNISYFNNCTFETNENSLFDNHIYNASLSGIKGVKFTACVFIDNLNNDINNNIVINNSSMKIIGDCLSQVNFELINSGNLQIINEGTLTIKDNAIVEITDGSTFTINDCAELEVESGGQVVVEDGGILEISPNAILNAHQGHAAFDIHSGAIIPDGFVNPYDVVPPAYYLSSGVHDWEAVNYKMFQNLVIGQGAKLTLNEPELKFAKDAGIVVKAGAELEIIGGELKSDMSCNNNDLWLGIRVEGNKMFPQSPISNQGYLKLHSGATISNAEIGIHVASNAVGSSGGGVIEVTDANFIDNITAISFAKYRYNDNHNFSMIRNSNFYTTDFLAKINKTPYSFIYLENVSLVKIISNTFSNLNPEEYPHPPSRGFGIYSANSDLVFKGRTANNYFYNLYTAIEFRGTSSAISFYSENNYIKDCFNGMFVSGANAPVIANNDIYMHGENYFEKVPTGIILVVLNDFKVSHNAIIGKNKGKGIKIINSNESSGKISNNTINNVNIGIFADGSDIYEYNCQVQCNNFTNNITADLYVQNMGISGIQGTSSYSASNSFYGNPKWNIYVDYNSEPFIQFPNPSLKYYAYPEKPYFPRYYNENVFILESDDILDCTASDILQDDLNVERIIQSEDSVNHYKAIFNATQDLGNTDELLNIIENTNNPVQLLNALLTHSPVLSDTIIVNVSENKPNFPEVMLASALLSNSHSVKSSRVVKSLNQRSVPMPGFLVDAILTDATNVSTIDELKSVILHKESERDLIAASLFSEYVTDTVSKQYNNIQSLKEYHPGLKYRYISVLADFEQGKYPESLTTLGELSQLDGLSAIQYQEINNLIEFFNIIIYIKENEIPYTHIDDNFKEALNDLATGSYGLPAIFSNNILAVADSIRFLADETVLSKSADAGEHTQSETFMQIEYNQTENFVLAEYNLGEISHQNPLIMVRSNEGLIKFKESIRFNHFVSMIDVYGWMPGNYKVQLINNNNIVAVGSFSIGKSHNSFNETTNDDCTIIDVYPNPSVGKFTIDISGCGSKQEFYYEIISSSGVTIEKGEGVQKKTITLPHMIEDLYIITIELSDRSYNKTLIIK